MVDLNIELPESFFQEEERDGYLVTRETKELWAVELDLLNEFDRVCKKHNLKYMLDFGTLLGAIRHKGFIPWDDDVDVSMLREDYDKLMEIGSTEFSNPYYLQNISKEKNSDESVSKLRRSDTTFLLSNNVRYRTRYNQGVFIDIFVFDNLPSNDQIVIKELREKSHQMFWHAHILAHRPGFFDGYRLPATLIRYLMMRFRYGSSQKLQQKREQYSKQFAFSGYVGNTQSQLTRIRPYSWFEEITNVTFENLLLPVPVCFDEMLKECYGDYMTPVHGGAAHSVLYVDVDNPYTNVLNDDALYKRLWLNYIKH